MLPDLENIIPPTVKLDNLRNQKKELKRIDWNIATRILKALHLHGAQKKSTLARITNTGYDKCVLYLGWLDLMGLIQNGGYSQTVGLTELGIVFCKTKLAEDTSKVLNQEM